MIFIQTEWHKIEKVNIEGSLELFKIANENGVKKNYKYFYT